MMSKRKAIQKLSSQSSKKQKLLPEGLINDPNEYKTEFGKGQIVSIKLLNWVTFDDAVIHAEPGLNLILGPNGTGKSSVVCALCLGLGGKPKSLGRADKASEFIKHGQTSASITIELFNPDGLNYSIKRVIKERGTYWSINNNKKNLSQIQKLVKDELNIKVDNLCQFLAQDRVSEFSRLNGCELCIETELAMEDSQLYRWHQYLIENGENASKGLQVIDNLKNSLRQNEAEISTLDKTIEQFGLKKTMEAKLLTYSALKIWKKVDIKRIEFTNQNKLTIRLMEKYKKKRLDVKPLQAKRIKYTKKLNKIQKNYRDIIDNMKQLDRRRISNDKKIQRLDIKMQEHDDEIARSIDSYKEQQKRIKKLQNAINKAKLNLNNYNQNDIDIAKKERGEMRRTGLKENRAIRQNIDNEIYALNKEYNNLQSNIRQLQDKINGMENQSQTKDKHIFGHRRDRERQFFEWTQSHKHEFQGEVYGPIVREMTVNNELHGRFLNSVIGQQIFYGYVCTHGGDWEKLTRAATQYNLFISIYTTVSDNNNNNNNNPHHVRRPVPQNYLNQNGVDGYLDQIYQAPPIIKQTLNDNLNLHRRGYSTREPTPYQLDNVLQTLSKQPGRLNSLITPTSTFSIRESSYSSAVLRSMKAVRTHANPILIPTIDYSQDIFNKKQTKLKYDNDLKLIQSNLNNKNAKKQECVHNITQINNKINELTSIITKYNRCKQTLTKKEKDLKELENDLVNNGSNPDKIKENLTKKIIAINNKRVQILEDSVNDTELIYENIKKSSAISIQKTQIQEEVKYSQNKIKEIENKNQQLKKDFNHSKKVEKKLEQEYQILLQNARRKASRKVYKSQWTDDDKKLSINDIEDKINHLQGRINVLFIDQARVDRYKRLKRDITKQTKQLSELENEQSGVSEKIAAVERKWKPKLEAAVSLISSKFGEFFAQFNNAQGRIELVEPDEENKYSDYKIDILTKFRSDQPWRRLSSSSQSGGEKSVSTMLYLLSLKQVTTVPFRVVDEINQGMDPINERRIMQILNFECTPNKNNNDLKLPQYFVVTPKLLPRLTYSPCSSVYVIFNGPFQMPQSYWKLNDFINTQKAISSPNKNSNNNDDDDDDDDDDQSEEDEETDDDEDEDSDS